MREALEITVNAGTFSDIPESLMARAARLVLEGEGHDGGEVSVTLLDDDGIRDLNRQYLDKDAPTDVIAFSLGGDDGVLGDVYLGLLQARRQAETYDVSITEELVRLTVHGVLHVLGHDHPSGPERTASPMYDLQERYVAEVLTAEGMEGAE